MTVDDFSGTIYTKGVHHVYFKPLDSELPSLKWEPEQQRFIYFSHEDEDINYLNSSSEKETSTLSHTNTISTSYNNNNNRDEEVEDEVKKYSCCALYGVLPVGGTSFLLYISEIEHVATLPFSGLHHIFAVKKFEWMKLPTPTTILDKSKEEDHLEDTETRGATFYHLSDDTIAEYSRVIEQFCTQSQKHSGGSYFFYSPTINLALDPEEMNKGVDNSLFTSSINSTSMNYFKSDKSLSHGFNVEDELSSQLIFQWNTPLLTAFESLVEPIKTYDKHSCVPAFIRGFVKNISVSITGVQLLLINKLSYRWAGTRYNRRGLDSAGSGIPANFSLSTLWVFPTENENETNYYYYEDGPLSPVGTKIEKKIATFVIARGSIPRRWSQPANLKPKPKITTSSSTLSVEELISHLNVLKVVLHGMSTLHFLDTTSSNPFELSLSKGFENAVLKGKEKKENFGDIHNIYYDKYDVKAKMDQKISFDTMEKEINLIVGNNEDDNVEYEKESLDFSKWYGTTSNTTTFTSINYDRNHNDEDYYDNNNNNNNNNNSQPYLWNQIYQQKYFVRVNCLDCLDRTNLVQSMIALGILPRMIRYVLEGNKKNRKNIYQNKDNNICKFNEARDVCKNLWAEQGKALSQLYAGSDPHFVEFLLHGKKDFYEKFKMFLIALQRWWQQSLYDGEKQDAVSLLTRQHDPVFFNSKFGDPFSRRLSRHNKMVISSFIIAILTACGNLILFSFIPEYDKQKEAGFFGFFWLIYFGILIYFVQKDGIYYANCPLLK